MTTCARCGNAVYGDQEIGRPLCDSCLDWVHFRHAAYKPEGAGYLTGEDLSDLELCYREFEDVLKSRGMFFGEVVHLVMADPVLPDAKVIPQIIQECDEELLEWLQRHPDDLHRVHPGTFERIVATIFRNSGFQVEFISSWNQADGGVDLLAVHRGSGLLTSRVAIQCKRHLQARRVSAEPIRSLNGVLDRFQAHHGVVAITSEFTGDAWREAGRYLWRIDLLDYRRIVTALQKLDLVGGKLL